ncbi:piwi/argonaute domain protein [Thiovulum sp. ES]|nr:piwi/argonaute domain protein [Thiovulum sp. ES]
MWSAVDPKKIESTKNYLISKQSNRLKEISNIPETKFLYVDWNGNIYFPQFLRKLAKVENDDSSSLAKLTPDERRSILSREWQNLITPVLQKEGIQLKPFNEFKKLEIPSFQIGSGRTISKNNPFSIPNAIRQNGFFESSQIYNIYILDTTGRLNPQNLKNTLENRFGEYNLKTNIQFTSVQLPEDISNLELEKKTDSFIDNLKSKFQEENFLPLVIHCEKSKNYNSIRKYIKRVSLQKGFPTQFLKLNNTNDNQAKFINIVFGIVAKYGDTLYLLNNKEKDVDYFIGFDVSRKIKSNGNVQNVSGGIYFFSERGKFLATKKINLEGEIIRADEVSKIFNKEKFQGKKIVIHRDGSNKVNEIKLLKEYFELNDIKAHIVYITKHHTTRIFDVSQNNAKNPEKGIYLKYAENKAILVTSDSKIGTKKPLKIEYIPLNDSPMDFQKVLKDLFDLTYMNFSSYTDISLPVTTHYSHQVSKSLIDGIEPSDDVFNKPYWL